MKRLVGQTTCSPAASATKRRADKRLVAAMICLLTACAGSAAAGCLTRCGLSARDQSFSCDELQLVEDSALWAFRMTNDKRMTKCSNLKGYKVQQMDTRTWRDDGRSVAGLTWCNYKLIQIGKAPLRESSLVHEIGHALQGCSPLQPLNPEDNDHSNWSDGGIFAAVELAKGYDGGI